MLNGKHIFWKYWDYKIDLLSKAVAEMKFLDMDKYGQVLHLF